MIIKKFIHQYNKNKNRITDENLVKTMISLGWIDWNCDAKDLITKTDGFVKMFSKIKNKDLLNNYTVTFYNSYTIKGVLYDEIILKHKKYKEKGGFFKINDPRRSKQYDFLSISDYNYYKDQKNHTGFETTYATNNIEELIEFLNNLNL